MRFLHRIDGPGGIAEVVDTDHDRLRRAIFLDGRTGFWDTRTSIATATLHASAPERAPAFIFHIGFCGSTLLASLLDRPGGRFVLKEPQAIADLASQWPLFQGRAAADEALRAVIGALAASTPEGEALIVKPSCWINPLLETMVRARLVSRAVFMTLGSRDYLTACFRGGRDRLAFCARLAGLFARYDDRMNAELAQAAADSSDPLARMARIVVLLHAWQTDAFGAAMDVLGPDRCSLVTFADGGTDAARRAGALADLLAPGSGPLASAGNEAVSHHAKDPHRPYDAKAQDSANDLIEHHHAARFDAALDWLASTLPRYLSGAASR